MVIDLPTRVDVLITPKRIRARPEVTALDHFNLDSSVGTRGLDMDNNLGQL